MKNQFTFNDADVAVTKLLFERNITFLANYFGTGKNADKWEHDKFKITIGTKPANYYGHHGMTQDFDYSMGIGHRIALFHGSLSQKTKRAISEYKQATGQHDFKTIFRPYINRYYVVKIPFPSEVLHSLILDGDLAKDTFEDFCSNLGYDSDSRKALETYTLCQQNFSRLRKILSSDLIDELRVLLEDY